MAGRAWRPPARICVARRTARQPALDIGPS